MKSKKSKSGAGGMTLSAAAISVVYLLISILWIFFSDTIVGSMNLDTGMITFLSISKGSIFVLLSSLIIYVLIRKGYSQQTELNRKLKESKSRFDLFANNTHELIWTIDSNGVIQYMNNASIRIFGYEPGEMIGRHINEFVDKEEAARNTSAFRSSGFDLKTVNDYENIIIHKDGSRRILLDNAVQLTDDSGKAFAATGTSLDITERKLAEQKLAESENRYKTFIECSPIGVMSCEKNGKFTIANEAAQKLTGYSIGELLNMSVFDMAAPGAIESGNMHFKKVLQNGSQSGETQIKKKNGEVITIRINSVILENGMLLSFFEDVSALSRTEKALKESEDRYKNLIDSSHGIIWSIDMNGMITYMNRASKTVLGYDPSELIGTALTDLVCDKQKSDAIMKNRLLTKAGGILINYEAELKPKEGSSVFVLINSVPLYSADGEMTGRTGTAIDITEKKSAEKKLIESERKFRNIVNTVPGVIWSVDLTGKILYLNEYIKELLNYEPNELIGKDFRFLVEPMQLLEDEKLRSEYDKTGTDTRIYQTKYLTKQGVIKHVLTSSVSLKDIYGNVIGRTGTLFDITDKVNTDIKLKTSEEKYRNIVETSHTLIYNTDKNGVIRFVNSYSFSILGYTPEEMIGKRFEDYIQQGSLPELLKRMEENRLNKKEIITGFDAKLVAKNGTVLDVVSNSINTFDEYGNYAGSSGTVLDITERKRTEIELKKNELKYRSVVETIHGFLYTLDSGLRFTFVNQGAADILGYEPDEILGKSIYALVPESDRDLYISIFSSVVSHKKVKAQFPARFIDKSGSLKEMMINVFMTYDSKGKFSSSTGNAIDISEIKTAERRLKLNEEKYRNIVETSHGVVWAIDENAVITFINEGAYDIIGYKPDELIGKHFSFMEKSQYLSFYRLRMRAKEKNNKAQFENIFWHKISQKQLNFINHIVFKYDDHGNFRGIIGNSVDVTSLKEGEEKLKVNEEKYRNLVEASQGLIWIIDTEGKFVYLSSNAKDFYGIESEKLIGRSYLEFKSPENVERNRNSLTMLLNDENYLNGGKYSSEDTIVLNDGTLKYIVSNGVVLRNSDGKATGVMGTTLDVTKRMRAEQERKLYEEHARLIYEAGQKLNLTLNIGEICRTIFDTLKPLLSVDSLVISSYDKRAQAIKIRGYWVEDKELDISQIPVIPLGEGIQSEAIRTGVSFIVDDYQKRISRNKNVYYFEESGNLKEEEPSDDDKIKSAIVVPLRVGGKVTGVLQLLSLRKNCFNVQQLRLVESLAHFVSASQQNALLFEEVKKELAERVKTEEALRLSEEKYRNIIETANEGIWILDKDNKTTFVNRKLTEILGYQTNELFKHTMSEFVEESNVESIDSSSGLKSARYELKFRTRSGGVKWTFVSTNPLFDKEEEYIGSIAMVTDIDDWKKAELALKESENKYRTIVETANEGIIILDNQNRIVYANDKQAEYLGYEETELIGKTIADFICEDQLEDYQSKETARKLGLNQKFERKFQRKDGSPFWMFVSASPILDAKGNKIGMLGMHSDINEWKLNQLKLAESENKYRILAETSPYSIKLLDREGKIIYANSRTLEMHGYVCLDEIIGLNFKELISESSHENADEMHNRNLEGEFIKGNEIRFRKKDGTSFEGEVYRSVIRNSSGEINGFIAVMQDITERKLMENKLRESEEYHKMLIRTLPLGVATMSPSGSLSFISPQLLEMFRVPDSFDPANSSYLDWLAPEEKEIAAARTLKVMQTGDFSETNFDYRLRRFDGSFFWANTNTAPIFDSDSNLKEMLIIVQDITEKRKIEEQIIESEEKYRTLMETIPEGIIQIDTKGIIQYCSPQIYDLFRIPSQVNINGTSYLKWLTDENRDMALKRFEDTIETGNFENSMHDYKLRRYDNSVFWAATNTSPYFDSEGKLSGILISIQDKSEIEKAEKEIAEHRERLSSILSTAMDAIITTNENRKIVLFNTAAEKLLKCSSEEVLGKDLNVFIPERFHHKHDEHVDEFGKSGKTKRRIGNYGNLIALRSDGTEIPVEISISRTKIGDEYFYTSILRDISERIKYEAELKNTNLKLHSLAAHLQKIREEERLIISRDIHDQLGQDLTALKMDIFMLAKDIDKKKDYITPNYISNELKSMAGLTDKTIKWVRKFSTDLRPDVLDKLGLFDTIEWQAKEFSERTDIKCKVSLKGDDSLLDKDQSIVFFRILQEALTNVMRHSEATRVNISMTETSDTLSLVIEDNGKGITNEQMERHESLGLISMKERAYVIGGNVEITGAKSKGTKVKVTIPKLITAENE